MSLGLEEKARFRFYKMPPAERYNALDRLRRWFEGRDEALLVVVFGSFLTNLEFRDIDIAVYTAGKVDHLRYKFEVDEALEKLLGIPVDTKVLEAAPQWFVVKALSEGKVLVEKVPNIAGKTLATALDQLAKLKDVS